MGLAAAVLILAACSDDPSAEEQVCSSRTDLRDAVDAVVADVRAANFGAASDGIPAVNEAYDELVSALGDLGQEQREALEPDVESIGADIEALPDAQGLDELGSSIDAILTGVQGVYDEITATLDCDG